MTKKRIRDNKSVMSEFKGGDLNKYTAKTYAIQNGNEVFGGESREKQMADRQGRGNEFTLCPFFWVFRQVGKYFETQDIRKNGEIRNSSLCNLLDYYTG